MNIESVKLPIKKTGGEKSFPAGSGFAINVKIFLLCAHLGSNHRPKDYESFGCTILHVTKSLFPIYRGQFKTIFRFGQIPLLHICNIKIDNVVLTLEVMVLLNVPEDSATT